MASSSKLIAVLGRRGGTTLESEHQRTTTSATVLVAVPGLVDDATVVATSFKLMEFDEFCSFWDMERFVLLVAILLSDIKRDMIHGRSLICRR